MIGIQVTRRAVDGKAPGLPVDNVAADDLLDRCGHRRIVPAAGLLPEAPEPGGARARASRQRCRRWAELERGDGEVEARLIGDYGTDGREVRVGPGGETSARVTVFADWDDGGGGRMGRYLGGAGFQGGLSGSRPAGNAVWEGRMVGHRSGLEAGADPFVRGDARFGVSLSRNVVDIGRCFSGVTGMDGSRQVAGFGFENVPLRCDGGFTGFGRMRQHENHGGRRGPLE